ncbi:hypothetical protein [Mesomycoplasma hyopneumoniae]|uniref:hypothetical protein n=1 Tax=Mesomycoplasma hyopneumoniae TaxID=2099 RepID=UPI001863F7B9|nr:hypothetical protein [Mesomycoplasma hyopneumoniae]
MKYLFISIISKFQDGEIFDLKIIFFLLMIWKLSRVSQFDGKYSLKSEFLPSNWETQDYFRKSMAIFFIPKPEI